MKLYNTVKKEAHEEQTIEKSRFIAHIMPVESKEEADEYISSIRKKYRDATHNVPAMVIGDKMQIQWGSDDGEPQGTSGAPMVQLLVNEGITNVVVVVTRYFGGIKLGPGGLVRAYTSSAKLALEAAEVCSVEEMDCLTYRCDYTYLSKLQNSAQSAGYCIEKVDYDDMVNAHLIVDPAMTNKVIDLLGNITSGKGEITNQSKAIKRI